MSTRLRGSSSLKMSLEAVSQMDHPPRLIRVEEADPAAPPVTSGLLLSAAFFAYGSAFGGGLAMLLLPPGSAPWAALAMGGACGLGGLLLHSNPHPNIQWAEWGGEEDATPPEEPDPPEFPTLPGSVPGFMRDGNTFVKVPENFDEWYTRFRALLPRLLELKELTYNSWSPKSAGLLSRKEWEATRSALIRRGLVSEEGGSRLTAAGEATIQHWLGQSRPRAALISFIVDVIEALPPPAG